MSFLSATEINTNTTISISDIFEYYLIDASGGNITVNLLDIGSLDGVMIRFQRKDGSVNTITIQTYSGQTFYDTTTSKGMVAQFLSFNIICYGSVWYLQ